ncbi:MAG TPA: IS110 family transposase [Thermoanaerobaculia bacterium]|nr:IS110 family transposase [Thermoanaerobaculia bacterium]
MQFVGIDISAKTLVVHLQPLKGSCQRFTFANTWEGHQKLCRRLSKSGLPTRVALEATGLYSLEIALALCRQPQVELMVVNPRSLRDFARADLRRSKTDAVDAEVLLEYSQRMRFQPWQPPSPEALELRAISRRIEELTDLVTQEKNRLHAVGFVSALGEVVRQDLEAHLQHLEERINTLQQEAWRLIQTQDRLRQDADLLLSTPGIALKSAIHLLAELSLLPADMQARQWVAYAGLDPRSYESGSSVHKPAQISRCGNPHLRRSLYMPALVAVRRDPHVRAFYEQLLARGKKPLQALVAVMRKLLHSLHGMMRHRTSFDGAKFRSLEIPVAS